MRLGFSFKNFRAISELALKLTDKTGKTVYNRDIVSSFDKFYVYTYKFDSNSLAALPEGEYTFSEQARAKGGKEMQDSMELPLVIDNTAPEIISSEYDENTKTLTICMKDNHYIDFMYYEYDKGYNFIRVTEDDIKDGIVTKTIDLSAVSNLDSVRVEIVDYAFNIIYRTFGALTDRVGVNLESLKTLDDMTSAKIYIKNNSKEDITADVILAFYDGTSKLIATSCKENFCLSSGEERYVNYQMFKDTNAAKKLKVFIWEPDTIEDLDKAKSFSVSR